MGWLWGLKNIEKLMASCHSLIPSFLSQIQTTSWHGIFINQATSSHLRPEHINPRHPTSGDWHKIRAPKELMQR